MATSDYESDWGAPPVMQKAAKPSAMPSYEEDWGVHPIHTFIGDIPKDAKFPSFEDRMARQKEISAEVRKQMVNPQAGKEFLIGGAQGIANLPQDVLNLPIQAGNYLNKTEAPTIPRWHFAPDTTAAKAGDVLSSLLPVPGAMSKLGPAAGAVAGSAAKTAISPLKIFSGLGRGNIKKLSAAEEAAGEEAAVAAAREQQAKGLAKYETGMTDPASMRRAAANKEAEIAGNAPPPPENLPIPSSRASAEQLANAEQAHNEATQNLGNAEHAISQHLNQGEAHDVDLAAQIVNHQEGVLGPNGRRIGGVRSNISDVYNHVTENLARQHVNIDNTPQINAATNRLTELVQQNQIHTPEAARLAEQLERLRTAPEQVPADEYLTMLRSAKDYARAARRKAFQPDVNAEERAEWHRRFNELDDQIEHMEDQFESSINPEDAQNLRIANRAWREQVKPLQRNATYQTILHKGRIEGNIINKLRGTDPGDVLMRNMIRNDPAMSRNIIGSQYADNPIDLKNPNRLAREYTENMPELQQLLDRHTQAEHTANNSGNALTAAQQRHENVLAQEQAAQKQVEKAESKAEAAKTQNIKLQKDVDKLNEHIASLEKAAKEKNVPLEKHVKIQKELAEAKAKRKAKIKLIVKASALVGVTAFGLPYGIYKGAQLGAHSMPGANE